MIGIKIPPLEGFLYRFDWPGRKKGRRRGGDPVKSIAQKGKVMKREFLQSLRVGDQPLPKEAVDAIMAENGRDIEAAKVRPEELETLTQNIRDWEEKYRLAQENHQKEIQKIRFSHDLSAAITKAGGRNEKAISALLDIPTLEAAEDSSALEKALAGVKKECPYLFREEATPPAYARFTGASAGDNHYPATLAGALREKFERMG